MVGGSITVPCAPLLTSELGSSWDVAALHVSLPKQSVVAREVPKEKSKAFPMPPTGDGRNALPFPKAVGPDASLPLAQAMGLDWFMLSWCAPAQRTGADVKCIKGEAGFPLPYC